MPRKIRGWIRRNWGELLRGNVAIELPGGRYKLAWSSRHSTRQDDHDHLFRLAADCSCVFDVGAKVGITALCMAGAMRSGAVYAFEASERSCFVMQRNIALNGLQDRIIAVNTLVGAESGDLCTYYWDFISGRSGIVLPSKPGSRPICKPALSLDDFARRNGLRPDLVKIDVEGAEWQVLAGMQDIMRKHASIVALELHAWPGMSAARHAERLLALLGPAGYRMFWPSRQRFLDDPGALADLNEPPRRVAGQAHFLLLPVGQPAPSWATAA
jgi:FkbM family methyltransferase